MMDTDEARMRLLSRFNCEKLGRFLISDPHFHPAILIDL